MQEMLGLDISFCLDREVRANDLITQGVLGDDSTVQVRPPNTSIAFRVPGRVNISGSVTLAERSSAVEATNSDVRGFTTTKVGQAASKACVNAPDPPSPERGGVILPGTGVSVGENGTSRSDSSGNDPLPGPFPIIANGLRKGG
jgi:hypothetical protein